jgi:hypothetical protein
MLFKEIIAVFLENHIKHTQKQTTQFIVLKRVVHVVTYGI